MSAESSPLSPQGFLLGHVLANGLPSQKRLTTGILLGMSPNAFGIAAAVSFARSARAAQNARQAEESAAAAPVGTSKPDAPPPATPTPPTPPASPAVTPGPAADPLAQYAAVATAEAEARKQLMSDARQLLDKVTATATAVGEAAAKTTQTQTAALEAIQRMGTGQGGAAPPTPPAPPPAAARKSA